MMFEHSVKVPRHYKIAANILKKVSTEGGSVKTLLYDDKLRHFRTDVLFALLSETIKHAADIKKIFEYCQILENEPRLDPWLAKVLTAEILFGKKTLPGRSKPELTVVSYKPQFEQFLSEHQDELKPQDPPRPRYVRVNTNLLTIPDAINTFQEDGFQYIKLGETYLEYLEQVSNLAEWSFIQDFHIKSMFVFPPGTKFHDYEPYLEGKIVLQDKGPAMAVHLLAPPPGSVVLDMCAAPGMKTTQIASAIGNCGRVYAVEKDAHRESVLRELVQKTGSFCVETMNKDVLEITRGQLEDVEYILLDPSCSGSGMSLTVHDYQDQSRLESLTSLQEKLLKHAMNSFPNAKRIVYSTCSTFIEENERVVARTVKASRAKWRVQDIKQILNGQWNNFGSASYGVIGTKCLYSKPDSDFTSGFFAAVLDRDQKDYENNLQLRMNGDKSKSDKLDASKKRNHKHEQAETIEEVGDDGDTATQEDQTEHRLKKKKSKYKKDKPNDEIMENVENDQEDQYNHSQKENKSKHKKYKANKGDIENFEFKTEGSDGVENTHDNEKPKSKKKKNKYESNSNDAIENNPITVNDPEDVPKKKKKKRKGNESNYPSDVIADDSLDVTEQQEEIPKKKRKKDKQKENEPNDNPVDETSAVVVDNDEKPFKKKKKHKKELDDQLVAATPQVECEIDTKKKKHKKSASELPQESVAIVEKQIELSKKKKAKKHQDDL